MDLSSSLSATSVDLLFIHILHCNIYNITDVHLQMRVNIIFHGYISFKEGHTTLQNAGAENIVNQNENMFW